MAIPGPRQLILKLLLGADGRPMSARALIASCALFGIRENSVRVALVRLAAGGMIEAEERGRYRIGPEAAGLADDVRTWRSAEARVRRWKGAWIAVHSGALGRSDRAASRRRDRALHLLGFRELERGLAVRPDNLAGGVDQVRARLHKLGLEESAAVFVATCFDRARESRARRLWNGKTLSKGYAQARQRLETWLARAPSLDLAAAARESFLIGSAAIRDLVFDPLLPAPLVDVEERGTFVDTLIEFDRVGHEIWRRLLASPAAARGATARSPYRLHLQ